MRIPKSFSVLLRQYFFFDYFAQYSKKYVNLWFFLFTIDQSRKINNYLFPPLVIWWEYINDLMQHACKLMIFKWYLNACCLVSYQSVYLISFFKFKSQGKYIAALFRHLVMILLWKKGKMWGRMCPDSLYCPPSLIIKY